MPPGNGDGLGDLVLAGVHCLRSCRCCTGCSGVCLAGGSTGTGGHNGCGCDSTGGDQKAAARDLFHGCCPSFLGNFSKRPDRSTGAQDSETQGVFHFSCIPVQKEKRTRQIPRKIFRSRSGCPLGALDLCKQDAMESAAIFRFDDNTPQDVLQERKSTFITFFCACFIKIVYITETKHKLWANLTMCQGAAPSLPERQKYRGAAHRSLPHRLCGSRR